MSLLSKIGIWISIGVFSLSAPMSTYAMETRITEIRDPGKTISPLDGTPTSIKVYTQSEDIDVVVDWLESQDSNCVDDRVGFCLIVQNKKEYLLFLEELKNNAYTNLGYITLGDISRLMTSVGWTESIQSTNNRFIAKRSSDRKWILGIEKEFGWDLPWYSLVRVFVKGDQLVYQQAEIIPYSVLHGGEGTNLEQFDSNLKKAVNRGWKFSSKSFQLRYSGLMKQFNKEWQLMQ